MLEEPNVPINCLRNFEKATGSNKKFYVANVANFDVANARNKEVDRKTYSYGEIISSYSPKG